MLFFEWQRIDWIKWMPIEVLVLLGLIILIRFLRWIFRWGPVSSSHLQKDRYQIGEFTLYKYQKVQENTIETPASQLNMNPSILFIPPLTAQFKDFDHLAGALALTGFPVLVLSPSNLRKIWISHDSANYLQKCCEENVITHIIVCDIAVPLITKGLQNYPHPLTWICLRPTFSWATIRPIWKLIQTPTLFLSKVLLHIRFFHSYSAFSSLNAFEWLPRKEDHGIFILPSSSWITPQGIEQMEEWWENSPQHDRFQIIHIKKGGWSFFRNETVVFGYILRILRGLI